MTAKSEDLPVRMWNHESLVNPIPDSFAAEKLYYLEVIRPLPHGKGLFLLV